MRLTTALLKPTELTPWARQDQRGQASQRPSSPSQLALTPSRSLLQEMEKSSNCKSIQVQASCTSVSDLYIIHIRIHIYIYSLRPRDSAAQAAVHEA